MPPATRRFNSQVISNLAGDIIFVSEPVTGHNHDMTALSETETAEVVAAAFSGIGDKGYQGSGYITPIKKPRFRELLEWEKGIQRGRELPARPGRACDRSHQVLAHSPHRLSETASDISHVVQSGHWPVLLQTHL